MARNATDLIIQLHAAQEEHSTNQNHIAANLPKIKTKVDATYRERNKKKQLNGQRSEVLVNGLGEIRKCHFEERS